MPGQYRSDVVWMLCTWFLTSRSNSRQANHNWPQLSLELCSPGSTVPCFPCFHLGQGAELCLQRTLLVANEQNITKNVKKIHLFPDFWCPEHYQIKHWLKINPLLHWCFGIRGDIALATARAISLRIPNHQCNNGLVLPWFIKQSLHLLLLWFFKKKKHLNVLLFCESSSKLSI